MSARNQSTTEIAEEMEQRLRMNPQGCRRIGNFGFIELEDSWGDEATILNTARISTTNNRLHSVADFSDRDRRLLYQLLRDQHGTPFETVYFRFRFIAPIFVLRQWVKHRMSSWNEFSMRYRKPISEAYVPDLAARSVDGFAVLDGTAMAEYSALMEQLFQWYEAQYDKACARIELARAEGLLPPKQGGRDPYRGRARELLRNVLPVATYSDVYWTVNFRSLMNFFRLRRKPDAQYEIREYADAAYALFAARYPLLSETMESVLREQEQHLASEAP
ncbi:MULTISPECIES: FAD-dependent thymidylate synthase [Acidithiobacillus]|jgi:thymidylate synthase (FAD)|uniref:FAD-dependent thymidylate synthase n=2 Tax=Acidithiobacillus caldus TaxID=33059 RepID=A0A1E7YJ48_9PROT|nr:MULTISPECIES: FAD-dependent thymidylate synthase [Acidithiobacillus]AIA55394.1 Thymidylate synthase thyX [Acidithiobacillus caldus ATCC 51756]MBU2729535.1 FAD-dependent thymidylate synthase [Acidithiobacillus caldus]MBU2734882.1 FAD-dependent thymidylate synthase [Acidithiobacillus caldus ATCC 51756]MBU2744164.1 FAD-dependent thymidylate synthase [Acidithiobacillus caldus]MBU2762013.1 FAD-dependent thymidylate synthase [Acidithiobacillus caldus]